MAPKKIRRRQPTSFRLSDHAIRELNYIGEVLQARRTTALEMAIARYAELLRRLAEEVDDQ